MFRIRYSILTFGREISLKVLSYIIIGSFVFFRVALRLLKNAKNQLIKL